VFIFSVKQTGRYLTQETYMPTYPLPAL